MGVEGWFERTASDLRDRVKNHPDRSNFSEGPGFTRPQSAACRGIAASSAGSCAMGSQGNRSPKKSEEGSSSGFFTQ